MQIRGDSEEKRARTYRVDGGDGRATDASARSDGNGEREHGREMDGSVVSSLLSLGLGGCRI